MTNIPTELLRTFVTVVELRSFTRAAQMLGVTQPAVSAQIKRLQGLLGGELLDKSAPGVILTEKGEIVASHARRLLAINDRIMHLGAPMTRQPLRIGIAGDLGGNLMLSALAEFRQKTTASDLRYQLVAGCSEDLVRDLEQGGLDLVIAFTESDAAVGARHYWTEELAWVRGPGARIDLTGSVPLVVNDTARVLNRIATSALANAGRDWNLVLSAEGGLAFMGAVAAGFGVAVAPRRFLPPELVIWDDEPLPHLSAAVCGVYQREGAADELLAPLADALAMALRAPRVASPSFGPERNGDDAVELRADQQR